MSHLSVGAVPFRPHQNKVEFQLNGDDSKVGRRINKIRNRKARSQRKARLKHQGVAAAPAGGGQGSTTTHGKERAREAVDKNCDAIEEWAREAGEEAEQESEGSEAGR